MATASDGTNQGRTGVPARQDPSPARHGRGGGGDATTQPGQTPSEIFGLPTDIQSSGMKGSSANKQPADVTLHAGQLDEDFANTSEQFVTDSGMPGSEGASPQGGGGESVTYTDPFGILGGVNRDVHTSGATNGPGDWTT